MLDSAKETVAITPGKDHEDFDKKVHQTFAEQASKAIGAPITTNDVVPPAAQAPTVPLNLQEEPKFETNLQEIVKGHETAPSSTGGKMTFRRFLKMKEAA